MCGEKQSIKRHYGVGTGKDCRLHVQRLNGIRGEIDEQDRNTDSEEIENRHEDITPYENTMQPSSTKWSEYVESKEVVEQIVTDTMYLDNIEVVLEVPKKRPKTFAQKSNFKCIISKSLNTAVENKCEPVITANETVDDTNYISTSTSNNNITNSLPNFRIHNITTSITGNTIEKKVLICKNEEKMIPVVPNKFVPPKINGNSKWAQFVDLYEENDNTEEDSTTNTSTPQSTGLFTLSDDADIDDILNF